jgi:hypothetical protein
MAEMEAIFCSRCGAQLSAQANFCEDCGSPVINQSPQPAPVAAAPPKKTSRAGLWIGILLLLASACGVMLIGLYFLL